jgi:hypothetical protein
MRGVKMEFIKLYWKQILSSIGGAWLFLSSLVLAVGGLVLNHLFREAPLSVSEWFALVLVIVEVFPFYFSPETDLYMLGVLLWLSKGWALGFGVCHLFRKGLRFESKGVAIGWWFCFLSLLGCAALLLLSVTQLLELRDSDVRSRVFAFCGMIFLMSSGLLLPIGIGIGVTSFFRWLLSSKQDLTTESSAPNSDQVSKS